jgi:hypothetical protein
LKLEPMLAERARERQRQGGAGWQMIEVCMWKDLTEAQRCEIELEENLHRKDLTQLERNKNLVELAEAVAERLRHEAETQEPRALAGDEAAGVPTESQASPGLEGFHSSGERMHKGGAPPSRGSSPGPARARG